MSMCNNCKKFMSCKPIFNNYINCPVSMYESFVIPKQHDIKPPLQHIPLDALEGAAYALDYGINKKHTGDNYEKYTISPVKYYGKVLRHLSEYFIKGEDIDSETGLCHLDCAMADMLILRAQLLRKPETDDRNKTQLKGQVIVDKGEQK